MEDIKIGKHSFNTLTLRKVTKEKAIESFANINKAIVERAWNFANPNPKPPRKTKVK